MKRSKLNSCLLVGVFIIAFVLGGGGLASAQIVIDGVLHSTEWDGYLWFTDNSEGPGTGYDDDPLPVFSGYLRFDETDLYLAFDVQDTTPDTDRDFLYVTIDIPPAAVFNDPVDALYWGSIPANPSFYGEAYLTGDAFPWDRSQRASTWGTDGGVETARTITSTNRYYEMRIPLDAISALAGDTIGIKVQARDGDYPDFQYVNFYPDMPDGITPIRADTRVEYPNNFAVVTLAVAPTFSCLGFDPPVHEGAVRVKKNRVIPFKAELIDSDGYPITDVDIIAPPVIQVTFQSGTGDAIDVTDDALSAGFGTEGNEFEFRDGKWQFNLKTKNYTAQGIYTVTMVSGDESEYVIDPTCEAHFMIE